MGMSFRGKGVNPSYTHTLARRGEVGMPVEAMKSMPVA